VGHRYALGEAHVLQHLLAQGALADAFEALAQLEVTRRVVPTLQELVAEAGRVAEDALVDDAHQPIELLQRVLQGRGGEQQLGRLAEGLHDGLGRLVARLVHIAQAVGLVDDRQIPGHGVEGITIAGGEGKGAQDELVGLLEGVGGALGQSALPAAGFQHLSG
jgi:hypothetical protein